MKITIDLEMVFGINIVEAVIDSREKEVKNLFVMESKSNSVIRSLLFCILS